MNSADPTSPNQASAATQAKPVALVLGAYGGIGSTLCRMLYAQGWRLALAGRDEGRLQELARAVEGSALSVDARDPSTVEACVERAAALHGRLDGIVNCVGSLILKPAHMTTDAEWQETLATNMNSAFGVVRGAARHMKNGGSVVLVSSAAARVGLANHEAIAAAKAGVEGLALSAAATYASRRIRINCVAPGLVQTPLTAKLTATDVLVKGSVSMHALGRLGEPSDVASAITWLLDPANSWITGQVLGVDGGLAKVRARA